MPLYELKCETCMTIHTVLSSVNRRDDPHDCPDCGENMSRMVSSIARTPGAWESGWRHGLRSQAQYDVSLGRNVYSEAHRDSILKEKGFVRASEIGERELDRVERQAVERKERDEKLIRRIDEGKARGLSEEMAVAEAMPAREIFNGEWD